MIFRRAVWSLTIQYSVLLLGLMALFSGGIYIYMERTFGGDYVQSITTQLQAADSDGGASRKQAVTEAADAGLDRLRDGLLLFDIGLAAIIPFVSYGMARRALRPVEASYEAQQRFVDDASHEMRTPLAVIQGELELALSQPRPKHEYKETVSRSLKEVHTLIELVASLLLLARGDRGQLTKSFTPFSLNTTIERAIAVTDVTHLENHASIEYNVPQDYELYGVPGLIERALVNILDNALKFTPATGRVTVQTVLKAEHVEITVTDTGIGMKAAEAKQAFARFWRAESARSAPGHGLGLALVQQIAELHGGHVILESRAKEGTLVRLSLPRPPFSR